jgi:prepilin-type N-terminal cleavage/methylation domain-containing protein
MKRPTIYPETGFSVLELLVVMSLSAVLTLFALPQYTKLAAAFDRMNARAELVKDLKRAQAESITEGCRGIIVIAADKKSYTFGCDYLDYDTASAPRSDVITFKRYLPSHITVASSGPIIFNSRGQTVDTSYIMSNTTITLTDTTKGTGGVYATGTLLGTGVFRFN